MTTEYDIDTPADLELLGGGGEEDTDQAQEDESAEEEQQKPVEEEAQEHSEEEPPQQKRDPVIPRARFDEVNAKLHAAREEAEQLRAALAAKEKPAPEAVDVDDLERQYLDAYIAGEEGEMKQIRAKINNELVARVEAASAAAISKQLAEREEETQFLQVAKQAISVYPFLDIESAAANQDAINEVLSWRAMYESQGHPRATALAMAVNRIGPYFHQGSAEQQPTDSRKQKAMRLAAETSAIQPPRVDDGVGTRAIPAPKEILESQDKWERASESERRRFLQ